MSWASFTAILGCMWPVGLRLDTPACWQDPHLPLKFWPLTWAWNPTTQLPVEIFHFRCPTDSTHCKEEPSISFHHYSTPILLFSPLYCLSCAISSIALHMIYQTRNLGISFSLTHSSTSFKFYGFNFMNISQNHLSPFYAHDSFIWASLAQIFFKSFVMYHCHSTLLHKSVFCAADREIV